MAVLRQAPSTKGKLKNMLYKPPDWLRGPQILGQNYTAWQTFNNARPDFGKELGPGEPYREATKKVSKFSLPVTKPNGTAQWKPPADPRTEAIRRRLRGM
ncbi:hypothetical protein GCM10018783_73740 [Streptomyces griseosporeus]|nr:hypothetical protein GCM10018783_73740 [Streptomyces griseosporeus]